MLVLMFPRVSSRVSGFPVASPYLWRKLQNLSFSKVTKQVFMSLCTARTALCDISTCLIMCRNTFVWHAGYFCVVYTRWVAVVVGHFGDLCRYFVWQASTSDVSDCLLCIPHSTLHSPPSAHHTTHSTIYTPHSILQTKYNTHQTSTLYTHTSHPTLYTPRTFHVKINTQTPHFTLYALHSTLYAQRFTHHPRHTLSTLQTPTFFNLRTTLYTPHHTLHSAPHSTLCTIRSTLHIFYLHSTLKTLHNTLNTTFYRLNSALYTPLPRLPPVTLQNPQLVFIYFPYSTVNILIPQIHT